MYVPGHGAYICTRVYVYHIPPRGGRRIRVSEAGGQSCIGSIEMC